jgi:hypothetical protein
MWSGFFLVRAIALVAGLLFWDQRRRHRAQRRAALRAGCALFVVTEAL